MEEHGAIDIEPESAIDNTPSICTAGARCLVRKTQCNG